MARISKLSILAALAACLTGNAQAQPQDKPGAARNVIVFLGDAGGVPTLSAAGIFAHDRPQSLFIQSLPNIALSETSALNRWVTDSAAGMTAIMTGQKTNNAMVSVAPSADAAGFAPLKTVLEHAEERGLSTGVMTNKPIWDATPAATYAHVGARSNKDDIFRQLLSPRFGDGPDYVIGKGLKDAEAVFGKDGGTAAQAFGAAGYAFATDPAALPARTRRAAALRDGDYAPIPAVDAAIDALSANPRGYFLMVEWDMHTDEPLEGLRHAVEMDDMIRHVSGRVGKDTLILFTADHSFALRLTDGVKGRPYAQQYAEVAAKPGVTVATNPLMSVLDDHSGEQVLVAATGPGAERVRGFMPNTRIFGVIMEALGWAR